MKLERFQAEIQVMADDKLVEQYQLYEQLKQPGAWDKACLQMLKEELGKRGLKA